MHFAVRWNRRPADLDRSVQRDPRFREYVVREHRPSYTYQGDIRIGTVLPAKGVTYYDVPERFGATTYRYTIVNDRTVLVDPRSRRIMQVVD